MAPTALHSGRRGAPRKERTPAFSLGVHPQGIQPYGNALLAGARDARRTGLGTFAMWSDELLLQLLAEYLDPVSIVRLGASSHMFYALATAPQVWRDVFADQLGPLVPRWEGSWRGTCVGVLLRRDQRPESEVHRLAGAASCAGVRARGVYSDTLYHAFLTSSFQPQPFLEREARRENVRVQRARKTATDVPPERPALPDVMERVSAKTTSLDTFITTYAQANRPCILVDAVDAWPCRTWTLDEMKARWAPREIQAEAIRASVATYVEYARSAGGGGESQEEAPGFLPDTSPYYLFDSDIAVGESDAASGWRVPELLCRVPGEGKSVADEYTRADLFSLFGELRPDYRWLIAGPARSGSGWHKDPNMTSAWNAVMQGSKYWMMLPPHVTPPGVYVTSDEAEVTAPASLSEWMLDYYAETKARHGRRELGGDGLLVDGVCRTGEVMYVPSGWWHLVINLDECVALTQNFVSVVELPRVLEFMKRAPDQISGFKSCVPAEQLYEQFAARLRSYDPALAEMALEKARALEASRASHDKSRPHGDWRQRLCGAGSEHGSASPANGAVNGAAGDVNGATNGAAGDENGAPDDAPWSLAAELDQEELGDVPW